ncbi:MAG: hypothetical protein JXA78_05490 [Anaerolineales bacterium]|nr:hypothetical protein [Anaerolineales bacterium]
MLKKILVSALIVVVLIAGGASAYNVVFTQAAEGENEPANAAQVAAISGESGRNEAPGAGQGAGQGRSDAGAPPVQATRPQGEGTPASPQGGQSWQDSTGSSYGNGSASGQGNQYGKNQSQSQGQGQGRGRRGNMGSETGASQGAPEPQNGFQEWITLQGVVSDYIAPDFILLTDDGQSIPAQLGNLSYIETIGLSLQDGERVSIVGYYDPNGGLAIGQISLSNGQTFTLRDDLGRPLWAGGSNR